MSSIVDLPDNSQLITWPTLYGHNMNEIDRLLPDLSLKDFTFEPYSSTGGTLTVGTGGRSVAKYCRFFDMVFFWVDFYFGTSGGSFGSGTYVMPLPIPSIDLPYEDSGSTVAGRGACIGNGYVYEDGSLINHSTVTVMVRNNIEASLTTQIGASNRGVTSTSPFTFGNNTGFFFHTVYRGQL